MIWRLVILPSEACRGEIFFPLFMHLELIGLIPVLVVISSFIYYYLKNESIVREYVFIKIGFTVLISFVILILLLVVELIFYYLAFNFPIIWQYLWPNPLNPNRPILTLNVYWFLFMGFQLDIYWFKLTSYVMLYLFWLLESWFEYTYIANNLSKVPVIDWNEHFSVKPENQNPRLKKIIWFGNLIFYVAAALYLHFYCFSFMKL